MYERRRSAFERVSGDFDRDANKQVDIYEHAEKLLQETVDEVRKDFLLNNELPLSLSSQMLMKLKSVKIILGFTNKTLSIDELEGFYRELDLNGDEGLIKSVIAMNNYYSKLNLERLGTRLKRLQTKAEHFSITYNILDGNYLCELKEASKIFTTLTNFRCESYFADLPMVSSSKTSVLQHGHAFSICNVQHR